MELNDLLKLYRAMVLLRRFDEMCLELKWKDLIMNGFHPYAGEEAVAVGACSVLRHDDVVISNHRPQGHALAKGCSARAMFCEMLGRRGGVSQGIGGPMQFIDSDKGFFCGSIVGSGMSVSTGVGLAMQREGRRRVCACFFGDGASNTGSFHEALNLAAIWTLPVVFILENNQYGEAMPVREFVSAHPISLRAKAYGLDGVTVDGNDVEVVASVVEAGVDKCRHGGGPAFIEAVTYRFEGHYGGDPQWTYRSREEVARWRAKCPLVRLRSRLIDSGVSEDRLRAIDEQVSQDLYSDEAWALEQPFPTVEQATSHVMIPLNQD